MSNAMLSARAPLKSKLRRRFYEAVVFLSALTTTWESNRRSASYESVPLYNNSFESTFKSFVNTLSQFCDERPGGDSVTAFAVLDLQDRIQYRFACNQIKRSKLEEVKAFVTDLLTTLRDDDSRDDLEQVLFEKALDHCRIRVCCYLTAFNTACLNCIATNPTDPKILDQLHQFRQAAPQGDFRGEDIQTFAQGCRQLMDLIEQSHRNLEGSLLAERTAHSSMNQSSSCWSELRHHAGRLKSYSVGTRTLIATAKALPRLVEKGFEVVYLQSSQPESNPIEAKSVTALDILGRMCRDPVDALSYGNLLHETSLDINRIIKETANKGTFRPIVHAELLVLQSLEHDGLVRPRDFFNAWKYIGASKPTCQLCHHYLQAHNGGFHVRSTHMNLYINWKPPDVLQGDGEAAIKAREKMLNTMVVPIREEGLRTLKERVPLGREHDSSTGMTSSYRDVLGPIVQHLGREVEVDMNTSFGD
ncbi:unnamed protein product [Discula destructiva]